MMSTLLGLAAIPVACFLVLVLTGFIQGNRDARKTLEILLPVLEAELDPNPLCHHLGAEAVFSVLGERVAWLCLDCDHQLPAEWERPAECQHKSHNVQTRDGIQCWDCKEIIDRNITKPPSSAAPRVLDRPMDKPILHRCVYSIEFYSLMHPYGPIRRECICGKEEPR